MTVKIIIGDCSDSLKALPDNSVHCVITSPPYFGLRDYGTAKWEGGDPACSHEVIRSFADPLNPVAPTQNGRAKKGEELNRKHCRCGAARIDSQIGLEETPAAFIAKLVSVFQEVRRVLRPDGTLWMNMGDSYAGSAGAYDSERPTSTFHNAISKGTRSATLKGSNMALGTGYKAKDMLGMPWRLAFALQDDGWYLRQDIVWSKPNPMPESVRDRCTKSHEYLFLFAKSEKYYFDQDAILEPVSPNTHARLAQNVEAQLGSDRAHAGEKTNGRMKAVARKSTGVGFGHGFDEQPKERVTGERQNGAYADGKAARMGRGKDWRTQLIEQSNNAHTPAGWNTGPGNHRELKGRFSDDRKLAADRDAKANADYDKALAIMPTMRNKRSVWTITTEGYKGAHFATFPTALVEPCIAAGTSERGCCPDCGAPFRRLGPKNYAERLRDQDTKYPPGTNVARLHQDPGTKYSEEDSPDRSSAGRLGEKRDQARAEGEEYARATAPAQWAATCKHYAALCPPPRRARKRSQRLAYKARATRVQNRPAPADWKTVPAMVLDPFGGAGTTALVADRMQRDAILLELNPKYAEMARNRINADAPLFAAAD